MSHATHSNAGLTPCARLKLARLIVEDAGPIPRAVQRCDVSWPTVKKRAEHTDSKARPVCSTAPANLTIIPTAPQVDGEQDRRPAYSSASGPIEIACRLGMTDSTVYAVLIHYGLNRLPHLDRVRGESIRRYERPAPVIWSMRTSRSSHASTDGDVCRYVGRQQGDRNRAASPARTGTARSIYRQPLDPDLLSPHRHRRPPARCLRQGP